MKLLFAVLALVVAVLALLAPTKGAKADWWAEMYQVQCIPELGWLTLRFFYMNSKFAVHAIERRNERLEKVHGLFVPRWHYRDDDDSIQYDFGGHRIYPGGYVRWPTRFSCPLSSGLVELILYPEPQLDGDQGSESISVSMIVNNRLILHDIPFHRCEDNALIRELVFEDGSFQISGELGWMAKRIGDASPDALRSGIVSFRVEPGPIKVTKEYRNIRSVDSSLYTTPLTADDILNPGPPHHVRGEEEGFHCKYLGPYGVTPYRERQVW